MPFKERNRRVGDPGCITATVSRPNHSHPHQLTSLIIWSVAVASIDIRFTRKTSSHERVTLLISVPCGSHCMGIALRPAYYEDHTTSSFSSWSHQSLHLACHIVLLRVRWRSSSSIWSSESAMKHGWALSHGKKYLTQIEWESLKSYLIYDMNLNGLRQRHMSGQLRSSSSFNHRFTWHLARCNGDTMTFLQNPNCLTDLSKPTESLFIAAKALHKRILQPIYGRNVWQWLYM